MADEVARLQTELTAARDAIRALEQRIDAADSRIAQGEETAQRLEQQISELRGPSAVPARPEPPQPRKQEVLDARDGELDALAAAVLRAADLRSRHIPDTERARLVGRTDPWPEWERSRNDKRMRAVALSARLATLSVDDPGHRAVAVGFRTLQRELAELDATRDVTRAAAEHARECAERIAADDVLRATDAADLEAGERAEQQILLCAQERVAGAVDRRALPSWFESAMGRNPHGSAGGWMSTAASLVAYRITYAVDDSERALGPEPTEQWSPSRHGRYLRLQSNIVACRPQASVSPPRPPERAVVTLPARRFTR